LADFDEDDIEGEALEDGDIVSARREVVRAPAAAQGGTQSPSQQNALFKGFPVMGE
jgi:hypothetical protein